MKEIVLLIFNKKQFIFQTYIYEKELELSKKLLLIVLCLMLLLKFCVEFKFRLKAARKCYCKSSITFNVVELFVLKLFLCIAVKYLF